MDFWGVNVNVDGLGLEIEEGLRMSLRGIVGTMIGIMRF